MSETQNPQTGGIDVRWIKSSRSNQAVNCVELGIPTAPTLGADVFVRNSRFPDGPALRFTAAEMSAFLEGAHAGEFDDLILD